MKAESTVCWDSGDPIYIVNYSYENAWVGMEKQPIKIAIADPHELSSIGLCKSLQQNSGVQVQYSCFSCEELIRGLASFEVDLILIDIQMPGKNSFETLRHIKTQYSEVKIIVFTNKREGDYLYPALEAGVDGYCMKDIAADRLNQIIEIVMDGTLYLDREIGREVIKLLPLRQKISDVALLGEVQILTHREEEILFLITKGRTNTEISNELKISIHTVKVHVCNILSKLKVEDRRQAAIKAIKEGLLCSEGDSKIS